MLEKGWKFSSSFFAFKGVKVKMNKLVSYIRNPFVKGLSLSILLALFAQVISHYFFPKLGAAFLALILGILLGNTFFKNAKVETGVKFAESRLLEISIVLMGLSLNFHDLLKIKWQGIGFILLQLGLTLCFVLWIGKYFGFTKKFIMLMAAGNAVCGSSAIGTVSGAIKAKDQEKGLSIAIVNLSGSILMILLPLLTGVLYHQSLLPTSGLIGGVLQSVGQVIAAAKIIGDPVVKYATIFKIMRILLLVVVVIIFTRMAKKDEETESVANKVKTPIVKIPWFICAFFVGCILYSLKLIPSEVSQLAKMISNQFEIIALGAIGLRVKFSVLLKEGPKALAFGGVIACFQVVCAVCLIYFLLRF